MRRGKWAVAVVLGLVLAAPAWAQRTLTFGGADPRRIVNQPVDTSQSAVPIAQPQKLPSTGFKLANILPRVGLPGGKRILGRSNFPTPEGMPGANYLKAFHYQRPQPVRP